MSYIYSIGFSTGAKTVLGPGHLTYSLGVDISGFISKNLKYSGKPDPPPSDMLIRSIAMAKIKVCVHTYLYFRELKCYTKKDNYSGFFLNRLLLQIVFSKLDARIHNIGSKCLAKKLQKDFHILVAIFCGIIAGLLLIMGIGMIIRQYASKCSKSNT